MQHNFLQVKVKPVVLCHKILWHIKNAYSKKEIRGLRQCDATNIVCQENQLASLPQLHSHLLMVCPVKLSNPSRGCGNQSLWKDGLVSRQEMGVLIGLPGGNLGLGLSEWYVLAAGTMPLEGQRQQS
jgi:hypothetical protein